MYLNDFIYTESKKFDCEDGVNDICIKSAGEKTSRGGLRMIELCCNVRNSNGVQYRTYIVEGEYFDKNLSRIMDCFGIDHEDLNPADWVNKVGRGRFDHEGKEKNSDGTERLHCVRCAAFLPKTSAAQPQTAPQTQQQAPAFTPKPQTQQPLQITQVINNDGIPEDIPF